MILRYSLNSPLCSVLSFLLFLFASPMFFSISLIWRRIASSPESCSFPENSWSTSKDPKLHRTKITVIASPADTRTAVSLLDKCWCIECKAFSINWDPPRSCDGILMKRKVHARIAVAIWSTTLPEVPEIRYAWYPSFVETPFARAPLVCLM